MVLILWKVSGFAGPWNLTAFNFANRKSFLELIFERRQKEADGCDFVKQEKFGFLQNAKVWEVDFERLT